MPDYSTWLPTDDAARAIGCNRRTLASQAKHWKIQVVPYRRLNGPGSALGPLEKRYHPGDVERVRKERNPGAEPFVLPAGTGGPVATIKRRGILLPDAERTGAELLARLLQSPNNVLNPVSRGSQPVLPPSELRHRLYLSEDEAVAFTGLGKETLDKLRQAGKIARLQREGPRQSNVYRRADLEKL